MGLPWNLEAWLSWVPSRGTGRRSRIRDRFGAAAPAACAILERLEPRVLMHGGALDPADDAFDPHHPIIEAVVAEAHTCLDHDSHTGRDADEARAKHKPAKRKLNHSAAHGDIAYTKTSDGWLIAAPGYTHGGVTYTQSHFLKDPESGNLYRWKDQITSTGIIDLYYDFRSEGGYANLITAAQRAVAEAALDMWEAATGGKLNFIRNTSAPEASIINIGYGDMAAVGYAGSNYLGISLNSTSRQDYSITWSTVWINRNYSWDTTLGNGDVSGKYDFFTTVAHEIGHSLGLGHTQDISGKDLMDTPYPGEMTGPSSFDLEHIRALYGYNTTSTQTSTSPTPTNQTQAGFIVTPTSGLVTSESGGTARFSVVLASRPTYNVTIGLGSSDTSEGVPSVAKLVFTPTNWDTPQYVTVTGLDDTLDDGDVQYSILLRKASSSDKTYDNIDPADVSVTNRQGQPAAPTGPAILVSPTSGLYTSESGGTAKFSVVLTTRPTYNVTFTIASSDSSEGKVSTGRLTFTPTNWDTPQYVTVTGLDDALSDGNVTYSIVLRKVSSSDKDYDNLDPQDVTVTNRDNEAAGQIAASQMAAAEEHPEARKQTLGNAGPLVDLLGSDWSGGRKKLCWRV